MGGMGEREDRGGGRARWGILVFVVAMMSLLGSAPRVSAEDDKVLKEIKSVVHKLQARYESTKDLQAEFTQKTTVEGFSTPITSTGRLHIKRPGRLRWDYLDPNREEIYVNQDDVKMFVPEHQQVLIGKLTQMSASQAPLQLLQGIAKLDAEFDITPVPGDARGAGGLPLVNLVPKGGEGQSVRPYQAIVLEVHPKTSYIKSLTLHELSGNVSTFEFSSVKANTGIQDSVFDFTIPPGVEVVRAPTFRTP